jgi:hypothetical protein
MKMQRIEERLPSDEMSWPDQGRVALGPWVFRRAHEAVARPQAAAAAPSPVGIHRLDLLLASAAALRLLRDDPDRAVRLRGLAVSFVLDVARASGWARGGELSGSELRAVIDGIAAALLPLAGFAADHLEIVEPGWALRLDLSCAEEGAAERGGKARFVLGAEAAFVDAHERPQAQARLGNGTRPGPELPDLFAGALAAAPSRNRVLLFPHGLPADRGLRSGGHRG